MDVLGMPKKSLRGKYNCRLKGRTNNMWFTTLHYITWYKMSIAKLIVYMAPCWCGRALDCAQRVGVKKDRDTLRAVAILSEGPI